jgi:hypothetical protein
MSMAGSRALGVTAVFRLRGPGPDVGPKSLFKGFYYPCVRHQGELVNYLNEVGNLSVRSRARQLRNCVVMLSLSCPG